MMAPPPLRAAGSRQPRPDPAGPWLAGRSLLQRPRSHLGRHRLPVASPGPPRMGFRRKPPSCGGRTSLLSKQRWRHRLRRLRSIARRTVMGLGPPHRRHGRCPLACDLRCCPCVVLSPWLLVAQVLASMLQWTRRKSMIWGLFRLCGLGIILIGLMMSVIQG